MLILFVLSVFGSLVSYVERDGRGLGVFTTAFKAFYSFPKQVEDVISGDENPFRSRVYRTIEPSGPKLNNLEFDLYGLISLFNDHKNRWEVQLHNFRTEEIIKVWDLSRAFESQKYTLFDTQFSWPHHVLPTENGELILIHTHPNQLVKIDAGGNILWRNDSVAFHHSIEKNHDGYLWTCGSLRQGIHQNIRFEDTTQSYRDELLVKVDPKNGRILESHSLTKIFLENRMDGRAFGMHEGIDPFHLNDIQPVLNDGPYWEQGDLWLSLRNQSSLVLYSPGTGKIKRIVEGPFIIQHDVDIIDSQRIAFFDNHSSLMMNYTRLPETPHRMNYLSYSRHVIYDLADSSYSYPYRAIMEKEGILSTVGAHTELLSDGSIFIESQQQCMYFVLKEDETLLRTFIRGSKDGTLCYPLWARVYEDNPLK